MTFKERLAAAEKKVNMEEIKQRATTPFRVDIENGTYGTVPVKAECGFQNNDDTKPFCRMTFLVNDGSDGDGKSLPIYFRLWDEQGIENCVRAVAALGYDVNDEEFSLSDTLESICDDVLTQQPEVKVSVSTSIGKEGTKNAGQTFQNFRIQKSNWDDLADEGEEEEEAPAPAKKSAPAPAAETKARKSAPAPAKKVEPEPDEDEEEAPTKARRGRGPAKTAAEKKIEAAVADDDDEEETAPSAAEVEEEDEPVAIEEGSVVKFKFKDEVLEGRILEFLEDNEKMRVQVGERVLKTKVENIEEVIS